MFNKNTENFSELLLFPQKVLLYKCKGFGEIKKELIEYCYSLKNKSTSKNLTLNNGWQSDSNSHTQKRFEPFLNFLNDNIETCLKLYQLKPKGFYVDTCVINIGGENSYHNSHIHPNTDISGVFWITIPNNSGEFVFENPSNFGQNNLLNVLDKKESENKKMYHSYHINPIEGNILLFPSNLRHSVNLNRNKKDRITIGFNVTFV
jgi:uncharacterized protein (TIGR02466 family)